MGINLSKEILKVVLALCALKLPIHPVLCKENKATQTDDLTYSPLSSGYHRLESTCVSLSQMADSIFSSNRKPYMNDNQQITSNPFIRVVTHKNGVLIHLGQLISISEDQKSFIMRNVISFDPLRVHERTISTLQPSEILALTESKLQSQHGKRGNLLSEYLQNQLTFNLGENSSSEKNKPMNLTEQKQDAIHGPLLITPGDVLICLSEVRELSIVPVMRFDQPKQMRQINVKSEFKRITEVKQHNLSQDTLTINKLTENYWSVTTQEQPPLQRQLLQEHEEKKAENLQSANKANRQNPSTESRRRRREKQRLLNKQRYSEVDMKTYIQSASISSASFLKCPTSTPHLTNSPLECSSCKWDDDGIVSVTIHQSLNSTTENPSNSLPKPRQKLSLQKGS
ncbi:hypothetical protein EWB00_006761 [Schistosoma japonicum]|uniref:Uncharacterized protein n=1 Tax=Schistosoma japonicum TaxID=6182 RepID=A0A4Z2CX00_SCHJA|nr:hypothetical protein EWB00_006761 [Schistosoma japonicum]